MKNKATTPSLGILGCFGQQTNLLR